MGHPVCLERLARDTGCLNGCMREEYIAKIGPKKWHKPLKDRAKSWELRIPGKIELGEAGGGSRVCARAPPVRPMWPWTSNETLEEVTQKPKMDRKSEKKGA